MAIIAWLVAAWFILSAIGGAVEGLRELADEERERTR